MKSLVNTFSGVSCLPGRQQILVLDAVLEPQHLSVQGKSMVAMNLEREFKE